LLLARAIIIVGLASVLSASASGRTESPRRIEIVASRFSYSPQSIVLKKDEPVVLVLKSSDVTHGLKVPELHIKSEIKKNKDTEIELTPQEAGHFIGKCAHFCGKGHGSMILQIDVVP
jgi:cytochrome c oxidase subunit 2